VSKREHCTNCGSIIMMAKETKVVGVKRQFKICMGCDWIIKVNRTKTTEQREREL
jgi:RNase P subunit RPR2